MDRHNSQPEQTDSGADRGSNARDCQNRRIVRPEADMPLSGWRIGPAHDREWVDLRMSAYSETGVNVGSRSSMRFPNGSET